jgi:aryl-alcohol dehydrogenase-like predicted oxidoreductase
MKKVKLGNTGYLVSPVIYGGITSMGESQADSDRYLARAAEAGVNYFDVAPSYGDAETIMGNSLKPFRKGVYLACKTQKRLGKEAEAELGQSLRLLHTDWFDVYQMHAMTTPEDVELAFSPGGVMELLVRLREKGVIRMLGFSAHSERAALECLKRYPFDSVMFPLNWMLHMVLGKGGALGDAKSKQGFGLIGIKSIVERAWLSDKERQQSPWPKSWCKLFDAEQRALRIAAMKYALHLGADTLIPPGNWECGEFMLANISECLDHPYTREDEALLQQYFTKVKDQPFFQKNNGGWPD